MARSYRHINRYEKEILGIWSKTETELWKARLKSLINTLFARYFKTIDSYSSLNITNANLYRENEKLTKINDKITHENENYRAENKDYKLLRKVFSNKRMTIYSKECISLPKKNRSLLALVDSTICDISNNTSVFLCQSTDLLQAEQLSCRS